MEELITIIVPIYNSEEYLEKCIKSIVVQTYKNFELILVNDGSTDNSIDICMSWMKKDKRVKVIDKENGGASTARNAGLDISKGKYLIFIDADDYIVQTYVENMYLAIKSKDYDIVQCDFKQIKNEEELDCIVFKYSDIQEISKIEALNRRKYKVTIWGKIYSSKLFDEYRFPEGIIYEDDASYYVLVDIANRISLLNEILYYYYMSDNSVMRNNKKNKSLVFLDIYVDRINYFKEKRDNQLLEGSYDRFCLVLMLFISNIITFEYNIDDKNMCFDLFKKYYKKIIKSKYVPIENKLMYSCFRIAPKIIGYIIGKTRTN